jgi:hypothetical protein
MDKLYYGRMGRIVPCVINGINCVLEEGPVDTEDLVTIGLQEIAEEKAMEEFEREIYLKGLMGDD